MLNKEIAEKYAQALFDLALEEDVLDSFLQEFAEVLEVIKEHELKRVLEHPQLTNSQKKEIFEELFAAEIDKELLNFLKLIIDKKRQDYLSLIYQRFVALVDIEQQRLKVEVKSACELSHSNLERLKNKLEDLTNKEINLEIKVMPKLIGGLILQIGDKVIDGSLLNYLKNLEEDLKSLEVSKLGVK